MNMDPLRRQLYRWVTLLGQGAHTEANNWLGLQEAQQCRMALRDEDYSRLNDLLAALRHGDPDRYGLCIVALADWPGRPAFLDHWLRQASTLAESWLVRGSHGLRWALETHEPGLEHLQSALSVQQFFSRLDQAEADLQQALSLAPDNPDVLAQCIAIAGARGDSPAALHARFQALQAQQADHYPGHSQMLVALCRHPQLSRTQAEGFAHQVCDSAEPGSPLLALIPQLHIEQWALALYHGDAEQATRYLSDSGAESATRAAFQRLFGASAYQASVLEPVLAGHFAVAFYLLQDRAGVQQAIAMIDHYAASYPWNHLCRRPMELIYPGYAIDRVREYGAAFPF